MKCCKHFALLLFISIFWRLPKGYAQAQLQQDTASRYHHVIKTGVLRIGAPGDYAPFAINKNGLLTGADITLGNALASAMGVKAEFVKTTWPNLAADMRNDAFDIALGGISITPERAVLASFSIPYHTGGKTFLCRREDSARFSTAEGVNKPGIRVIVNKGGTNESVALALFPTATIEVFPDNIGVFKELIAGHADVMLTDDTEADLKVMQYPQLCRSLAGTINKSDKAIWIHKDTELVNFINNWLQKQLAMGMPQQWLKEAMLPGK